MALLALQGEASTGDLIFGAMVLAVFLVLVFGAGILLSRFKNARFARAASAWALAAKHRRVIHVEYAAIPLLFGLEWAF